MPVDFRGDAVGFVFQPYNLLLKPFDERAAIELTAMELSARAR